MSSAARIEELQKKFDENPRRYFAPLANECRKAGDLDAAIAICRAHLPHQPGHMSGHIVYGQALFESGELGEARAVFETALGLDPENLIALRHMGDIAARDGDISGARQWYSRVLETDPRNEEIQSLVGGLGHDSGAPVARYDAGDAELPVGARNEAIQGTRDEEASVATGFDVEELPRVRGGLPTLVDPALLAAAAEAMPGGELGESSDGDADAELIDLPVMEVATDILVTAEAAAAAAAWTPRDELLEPTALEFEVPATEGGTLDGLEATTFEPPPATEMAQFKRVGDEALLDDPHPPAPLIEGLESVEFDPSGYGDSAAVPVAGSSFELEPADVGHLEEPRSPQDSGEAFVTETMAELYLRQGYHEEALDVYRKLVRQSPHDSALRFRMERIETEQSGSDRDAASGSAVQRNDDRHDLIAGLPRAMEPALVAAAGSANPLSAAPEAGFSRNGPTIRQFLSALAAGVSLPTDGQDALDVSERIREFAPGPLAIGADLPAAEVVWPADEAPTVDSELAPADSGDGGHEWSGAEPLASGEGLDALFGVEAHADDSRAAETLSAAFLPGPGEPGSSALLIQPTPDPLLGRPARPAGNELSLDHVFGAPRQGGAPRNTGSFSFDQFFAEGAVKPAGDEPPEPPAAPGNEEDLEQFNSWLHNLRKQ